MDQNDIIENLIRDFSFTRDPNPDIREPASNRILNFKNHDIFNFIGACCAIMNRESYPESTYLEASLYLNSTFTPSPNAPLSLIRSNWLSNSLPPELPNILNTAIARMLLFNNEAIWRHGGSLLANLLNVSISPNQKIQSRESQADISMQILKNIINEYTFDFTKLSVLNAIFEILDSDVNPSNESFYPELLRLNMEIFMKSSNEKECIFSLKTLSRFVKHQPNRLSEEIILQIFEFMYHIFPTLTVQSISLYKELHHFLKCFCQSFYRTDFIQDENSTVFNRFNFLIRGGLACQDYYLLYQTIELWMKIAKMEYKILIQQEVFSKYKTLVEKNKIDELAISRPPKIMNICLRNKDFIIPILLKVIQSKSQNDTLPDRVSDSNDDASNIYILAYVTLRAFFKIMPSQIFEAISNLWNNYCSQLNNVSWPVLNGFFLMLAALSPELKYEFQTNEQISQNIPELFNHGNQIILLYLSSIVSPQNNSPPIFSLMDTAIWVLTRIEKHYFSSSLYEMSITHPQNYEKFINIIYSITARACQFHSPPRLIYQIICSLNLVFRYLKKKDNYINISDDQKPSKFLFKYYDITFNTLMLLKDSSASREDFVIQKSAYMTLAPFFILIPNEKSIQFIENLNQQYQNLSSFDENISTKLSILQFFTILYPLNESNKIPNIPKILNDKGFTQQFITVLFNSLSSRCPELHEDTLNLFYHILQNCKYDHEIDNSMMIRLNNYFPDAISSGSFAIISYAILVYSELLVSSGKLEIDSRTDLLELILRVLSHPSLENGMYQLILLALSKAILSMDENIITPDFMIPILSYLGRFVEVDFEYLSHHLSELNETFTNLGCILKIYKSFFIKNPEFFTRKDSQGRKIKKKLFEPIIVAYKLYRTFKCTSMNKFYIEAFFDFIETITCSPYSCNLNIQFNGKECKQTLIIYISSSIDCYKTKKAEKIFDAIIKG